MKLECLIPPRRDGTVIASVDDAKYVFRDDGAGNLVADVDSDGHISTLLNLEGFIPANEADYDVAAIIASGEIVEDEGSDDEAQPPIESNTPTRRGRRQRGA